MTQQAQAEALRLAEFFDDFFVGEEVHATTARKVAAELRRLHARVQELGSNQPVRYALQTIHDTFKRDLDDGYITRDKQFAVEIAAEALSAAPTPTEQEAK